MASYKHNWHVSFAWLSKLEEKLLEQHFKGLNPARILDVGGSAGTTQYLKSRFPDAHISCINIDEKTLEEIGEDIELFNASAEDMPFESSKFDLVFCRDVIAHIFRPDHLVEELKRVTVSGGVVVVLAPNLASWWNRVLLLFGYSPTSYTPFPYKSFGTPRLIRKKGAYPYDSVRVFTYKAIKEIFSIQGFKLRNISSYPRLDRIQTSKIFFVWYLFHRIIPRGCRERVYN